MNKRRIVARILAVLMAFTMLPQTAIVAMAEEGDQGTEQKTVTITYAVEGNGSVDPTSETVDLEKLEIKGSTATADEGYEFVNWTNGAGEEVTTEAKITPAATDVTEDVTYTAHFQEKAKDPDPEPENPQNPQPENPKDPQPENPVTITITYAAGENGSVKVTGTESDTTESFQSGDTTYTIKGATATANEGYEFVNWTVVDGEETKEVSTEATYTPAATKVTEDVTYTANFKEKAQPVTPPKAPAAPSNDGTVNSPADVEAGKAYVVSKQTSYDTLTEAIRNATSTDTIYLGKGTFSSYDGSDIATDKNLTIIGSGTDKTTWNIGTPQSDQQNLNNGDYSLRNASSITFKSMTLQAGVTPNGTIDDDRDYLGFTHIQNGEGKTVVEDCVINGQTSYWGYTSATFKNTTFNAPDYQYALWVYSSPTMTIEGCTFNMKGKAINVYRDYGAAAYTLNIKDCTFKNVASSSWKEWLQGTKQVLNINDSVPAGQSYTINISGNNTISGSKVLNVDQYSCSRFYGFGSRSSNNAGHTTVKIEGTTVFENGELVDHEHGTIDGGSYSNGKASNTTYDYSEGHKDGAYTITEDKDWTTDPTTGLQIKNIVKTCNYCGWSSKTQQTKTETKELPGDILIDGDTEHSAVAKRDAGATFSLTGALQISEVQDQMTKLEQIFAPITADKITLSDLKFGFTATLTVPDGITLPDNVQAQAAGMADTYKVASTSVNGKTVTVTFDLTDAAKNDIKTYADLKTKVNAAGDQGWLKVTIPNCKVDSNVEAGTRLKVTGTVGGNFSATATSEFGVVRSFSYEWNGTQWADGKDATAAADNNAIQLTIEVTVPSTPEEPETPSTPDNNDGGDEPAPQSNDSTPAPAAAPTPVAETVVEVTESGNEGETTEETVEEVSEGGSAGDEQVVEITEGGAIAATGDESPIVLYGMVTLMAGAALVLWASKRRAR